MSSRRNEMCYTFSFLIPHLSKDLLYIFSSDWVNQAYFCR